MARRRQKQPDLSYIAADLRPLAVPIAELIPDPRNARKHGERNLQAITGSLRQFGQVKPIVVVDRTVIAGNGTLEAAKSIGWTHLACVQFPDVESATAFALADNRTAELAEWDREQLKQTIAELGNLDVDLDALGFSDDEIDHLVGSALAAASETAGDAKPRKRRSSSDADPPSVDQTAELLDGYRVLVECSNEQVQQELLAELTERGFECRALTS